MRLSRGTWFDTEARPRRRLPRQGRDQDRQKDVSRRNEIITKRSKFHNRLIVKKYFFIFQGKIAAGYDKMYNFIVLHCQTLGL